MRVEPFIYFNDRHHEQKPLACAFSAYRILERHPDLMEAIMEAGGATTERKVTHIEHIGRMENALSRGAEVSPARIRAGIAVLEALRTACEREKTFDYGPAPFANVIIEARDEQIRNANEALAILRKAEKRVAAVEAIASAIVAAASSEDGRDDGDHPQARLAGPMLGAA